MTEHEERAKYRHRELRIWLRWALAGFSLHTIFTWGAITQGKPWIAVAMTLGTRLAGALILAAVVGYVLGGVMHAQRGRWPA